MTIDDAAKILGIETSATKREVKKAFRKLAHLHHPDKGGDAEAFKRLTRAYGILLNFGVVNPAYAEKPIDPEAYKEGRAQEDEMEELIVDGEVTIERPDGSVDIIPRGPESFQLRRRRELDAEYKKRKRPKEIHA